jgi:hypothetical protein
MTAREAAEDCASRVPNVEEYTDIIELAIAEAQKPLVDALDMIERKSPDTYAQSKAKDALAKVKK